MTPKLLHPLAALLLPFLLGAAPLPPRVAPLALRGAFLADVTPTVPFPTTGNWFIGLIGALGVIYLILGVWSQARKLFGRRPPIDEDIARLQATMKIELEKQTNFLTRRIDEVHANTEELRLERERTWKAFQTQISELGQQFAYLSGALGHKPKR